MSTLSKQDVMPSTSTIAYGFCHCGCGQRTTLIDRNEAKRGLVKGTPNKFIGGHQRRIFHGYTEEDRGYKTPCWIWNGPKSKLGYGIIGPRYGTRVAHRAYYENKNGPVPNSLDVDHLCRQRACVNPDHLEIVIHAENMRRGAVTPLTHEDVCYIKRLLKIYSVKRVAQMVGRAYSHIYQIAVGKCWKGVE